MPLFKITAPHRLVPDSVQGVRLNGLTVGCRLWLLLFVVEVFLPNFARRKIGCLGDALDDFFHRPGALG